WSGRTYARCRSGCWRWATTPGGRTGSTVPAPPGPWPSSSARWAWCRTAPAGRRPCTRCAGWAAKWWAGGRSGCASRSGSTGPGLVGKRVVVDPGHGGTDAGVVVTDGDQRWSEAELMWDLASRLEGRLAAAGVRVHLTRGPRLATPMLDAARAHLANDLGADL